MTSTAPDLSLFAAVVAEPSAAVVDVTPTMAEAWLAHNTGNRPLRHEVAAKYARNMAAGRWQLNGEAVKFSTSGQLLDGQHRLLAIILAGLTVPMFVVTGLPPEAQENMDTGRQRTAGNVLALQGEKNAQALTAAVRLALTMEAAAGGAPGRPEWSTAEVLAWLDRNPDMREAVAVSQTVARQADCLPSVVAFTLWRLSRIDADAARRFWIDAAEKVGLTPGDPVLALTRRLAEGRRNRERLRAETLVSAVYRVWNARRRGQALSKVQLTKAGEPVAMVEPI